MSKRDPSLVDWANLGASLGAASAADRAAREVPALREDARRQQHEAEQDQQIEAAEDARSRKGHTFFGRALDSMEAGDFADAIELLETAARSFPRDRYFTDSGIYCRKLADFRRAHCLAALGRRTEAVEVVAALLDDPPALAVDEDYARLFLRDVTPLVVDLYSPVVDELAQASDLGRSGHLLLARLKAQLHSLDPDEFSDYAQVAESYRALLGLDREAAEAKATLEAARRRAEDDSTATEAPAGACLFMALIFAVPIAALMMESVAVAIGGVVALLVLRLIMAAASSYDVPDTKETAEIEVAAADPADRLAEIAAERTALEERLGLPAEGGPSDPGESAEPVG